MLGGYLRARRELVTPASVGLPVGGLRRVAGLRREEVAMLAGISPDYYLRLEQGRDRNPSTQVLEALAGVLDLDRSATDYLIELVTSRPDRRRRDSRRETVPAGIRQLLATLPLPAFVEGRYLDVLAANHHAGACRPTWSSDRTGSAPCSSTQPSRRSTPTARHLASRRRLPLLGRQRHRRPPVRPARRRVVATSERFRLLWARHDVRIGRGRPERIHHPQVGELALSREKLAINGAEGQVLVLYHAQPGTSSGAKLALLGALASPPAEAGHDPDTADTPPPRPHSPGRRDA